MTLAEALRDWHEFYATLAAASATLVGLLFVAANLGSGVFSGTSRAPLRVFLSASVIHFSSVLTGSLIVLVPVQTWLSLGAMVAALGGFGLLYYALTWRDMVKDGLRRRMDYDDLFWYTLVPAVLYLCEAGSGVAMATDRPMAQIGFAVSLGLLLLVGIRNAWDITIWVMTRPRE